MRILVAVLLLGFGLLPAGQVSAQVQSPEAFLGYELGARFTLHHRVIDYFEHVAANSDRVVIEQYGETYEGRPLITAYVASPKNMAQLDEIRLNNLRRAGIASGASTDANAALVWLSYNVHGNESVGMEASMQTLYALVGPANERITTWLDQTVVVIDPCLNPDGRDRYASWYNRTVGRYPDVQAVAREHSEPWPYGRTNHYLFDLNRDWAWMTQQELQARVPHYNKWMPHVHVDFHEQGVNSPYYFAPAAEPYHEAITPWQREFQEIIGKNHARYFDANGWLYFTAQIFDLLYPGYGDTWPMFNGAIGMTYEQAGSGRAGLGIVTAESDTLTLADRILHHHTTGLSTIEAVAENKDRVLEEFERFFDNKAVGPYGAYILKGLGMSDLGAVVASYLDNQGIQYAFASGAASGRGYNYQTGNDGPVAVEAGDMVLFADQPKSTLLRVLFDPAPVLSDSVTYDVTSWALPYVFGVDGYALLEGERALGRLATQPGPPKAKDPRHSTGLPPYAYIVEWENFEDARFLAALLHKDIKLRYAEKPFTLDGRSFDAGTLIITRTGNQHMGAAFDAHVRSVAAQHNQPLVEALTGYVDAGADFGSGDVPFLDKPAVAMLIGESIGTYSAGEMWHYFDQQLAYPVTLLDSERFSTSALDAFDVLLIPSGRLGSVLSANSLRDLRAWVRAGGRLVVFESAARFFVGKEGFRLSEKPGGASRDSVDHAARRYEDRERDSMGEEVPGAIYQVKLDNSHPLAFGYPDTYHLLKRNDDVYAYFTDTDDWNVGVLPEDGYRSGFVGVQAKAHLRAGTVIGIQEMGRGDVVYFADNPFFRGFWYSGRLFVANAIFLR
ncbi:MAG: M14 metallopeptidase family protein [Bacteroidota bacterium]